MLSERLYLILSVCAAASRRPRRPQGAARVVGDNHFVVVAGLIESRRQRMAKGDGPITGRDHDRELRSGHGSLFIQRLKWR